MPRLRTIQRRPRYASLFSIRQPKPIVRALCRRPMIRSACEIGSPHISTHMRQCCIRLMFTSGPFTSRLPRLVRNPNCNPKSGPSSPDPREAKQRSLYKTCEAPSGFPTLMPAVPAMLNNNKQSAQARIAAFSKQGSPSLSVGCMQTFVKHSRSLVTSLISFSIWSCACFLCPVPPTWKPSESQFSVASCP